MKTCSKCKRDLPLEAFSKSPRYRSGRYPSCKKCQQASRKDWLLRQTLCSKCGQHPRLKSGPWCDACRRQSEGRSRVAWVQKRAVDPNFCPKCQLRPRLEYHGYCQICARDAHKKWRASKRGTKKTPPELRKKSARHYVNTLYRRGKIKRQPCELCGNSLSVFHHLDYTDRTTNIMHLCFECHVAVERAKRKLLTIQGLGV